MPGSSQPAAARTRQSPEVRRPALLDAAVAVLAEQGADGASLRVIAAQAGVTPGLLAYHFGSKEGMLSAAYRHLSEQLNEAGEQAVAQAGRDPRDRLRAFLAAGFHTPFIDRRQLSARVALWGLATTTPSLHEVHVELYTRYRAQLAAHIQPLAPGQPVDPRLVFAVSALLDGLWLERSAGETGYDAEAMIDECVRLIDAGLGE